jgi:hypothetical protein
MVGILHAWQLTGKVVGISDGDTISVLREGKTVKVRIYGIYAPEKAQAFGTRARQFTTALGLPEGCHHPLRSPRGKGALARWPQPQPGASQGRYAPYDTTLAQLKAKARTSKRGLRADAHPIPPWEWRKGQRASSTAAAAPAAVSSTAEPIIGNRRSKVYPWSGCPDYDKVSSQNRVTFSSRESAEQAGYRPAGNCR